MSYRSLSLLPLTILQVVQRTFGQLTESSIGLPKRALPLSLVNLVPNCTTTCLESFISANYQPSECSNELDLTCLCTHTTPSGLTIGEVALQCLASVCPDKDTREEISVYNICSAIPNAIAETAGTITVTMTSTNLLSASASTAAASSISSTLPLSILGSSSSGVGLSSIVSDSGTPALAVSTSSTVQTTLITASVMPSSSAFSVTASTGLSTSMAITQPAAQTTSHLGVVAPVSSQQSMWTTGQITGVAVGGAAVLVTLGILFLILCLRRRKRQRRRSTRWSVATEKPPFRPSTPRQDPGHAGTNFANPSDLTVTHGQRYYGGPAAEEKRRSFWSRSIPAEDIGVAVSPEIAQHDSPDSFLSQRTSSQLLPALPNPALWPAPLRLSRQIPTTQGAARPESTATIFEEDVSRDMTTHQAVTVDQAPTNIESMQEMTERSVLSQIADGSPIDVRAQMYVVERATAAATKSPITLTPVYDNGIYTPVYDMAMSKATIPNPTQPVISAVPQPHYSSPFAQDPRRPPSLQANARHQRPLQTYSSAPELPRHQQHHPRNSASTPSLSATTNYTNKRSTTPRKGSIDSAGSDVTTFDTGDDTTPEQELDKRYKLSMLSPVMESLTPHPSTASTQGSPIKGLQYPRIPRPAAIAKQAERTPRPRAALQVNTTGPQPQPPRMALTRDQLVHDECSFLQSQSTSQDSPEPSPSLLAKRRGDKAAGQMLQAELKLNPKSATRTAPNSQKWQVIHPDDPPVQSRQKPSLVLNTTGPAVENERTSKRNSIGLTPTRRGDDLFLTVQ